VWRSIDTTRRPKKKGTDPPAGAKETHAEVRDDMGDDDYLSIPMFINES